MPYTPFTPEQLTLANETDLVQFLTARGEKLKRVGNEYKWVYSDGGGMHDSITISGSRWYDHKNLCGGRAIKLMQTYFGLDFPTAVNELLGGGATLRRYEPIPVPQKKEFALPDAYENMRRVFAYLTKGRFIDGEVISHFAHEHKLYEDAKYHNVVFVGYDGDGVPRQASKRSTYSFGTAFKQTVDGSDTRYSFSHFGNGDKLYVFEAPIDMLSFITMNKSNWQENSYIAINGVYESAVITAMEEHPNLYEVCLCVDNDEGGIEAVDRLTDILHEKGFGNVTRLAPECKDWNEDLKQRHGVEALPAVPHRRVGCYGKAVEAVEFIPMVYRRLAARLTQLLKECDYTALASTALSTAAGCLFYGKRYNRTDEQMVQDMKAKLKREYKPYTDKACAAAKQNELQKQVRSVVADLKTRPERSIEQYRELAKVLYNVATCALRCRTEEMMGEGQMMAQGENEYEETPSDYPEALSLSM